MNRSATIELDAIAEVLARPQTIVFVGAGVSAWSGLPSWHGLLSKLIDFAEHASARSQDAARKRLQAHDLLAVADLLRRYLKPNEVLTFLRSDVGLARARPHLVHQLVTTIGPTCFVTTNYDKLIEQQLAQNQTEHPRVVTNRQLADMASIYRADATNFVFKAHGDIEDASSIVLSESDFQRLVLGSELAGSRGVAKTLEILLATRPIVFLGYSMSDLDLRLILANLQNTFDGSAGDYWAILPNLDQDEASLLWEKYRIRTLSYRTQPGMGTSSVDHSEFLTLLNELHLRTKASRSTPLPVLPLSLARYGRQLASISPRATDPTTVFLHQRITGDRVPFEAPNFHHSTTENVIANYPHSLILEGPAGSGKSHAIQRYLASQGALLRDQALESTGSTESRDVPILLDARLYEGSFSRLAAAAAPSDVFSALIRGKHRLVVIIDSIDEMPALHLQGDNWIQDLTSFLAPYPDSKMVFATRRADLVPVRDLAIFHLEGRSDGEIREALHLSSRKRDLNPELLDLLRTPFMLSIAVNYEVELSGKTTAASLLQALVERCLKNAGYASNKTAMLRALKQAAFEANQTGRDTFPISALERELRKFALPGDSTERMVDKLVYSGLLLSETNGQVRLVHRSVLEYLAGLAFVDKFRRRKIGLAKLLETTRWDNCLAWCSSFLGSTELRRLVAIICKWDMSLALRLARSAEDGRAKLLSLVLDELIRTDLTQRESWSIEFELENTSFAKMHRPLLKALLDKEESIGGVAAAKLVEWASPTEMKRWIRLICAGKFGYNMGDRIGSAVAKRIDQPLAEYFVHTLEESSIPPSEHTPDGEEDHRAQEHWRGLVSTLENVEVRHRQFIRDWSTDQSIGVRGIVCEALSDSEDSSDFKFIVDCWMQGVSGTSFVLYLRLKHSDPKWLKLISFTSVRLRSAKIWLDRSDEGESARSLLRLLCERDAKWDQGVVRAAHREPHAVSNLVLRMCSRSMHSSAFDELSARLQSNAEVSNADLDAASLIDSDDLVRDAATAVKLLATSNDRVVSKMVSTLRVDHPIWPVPFTADQVDTLLTVCMKRMNLGDLESHTFGSDLLDVLLSNISVATRSALVGRANDKEDPDRLFILQEVVGRMEATAISIADLSPESQRLLLERYLGRGADNSLFLGYKLADFATEPFIESIAIPFIKTQMKGPSRKIAAQQFLNAVGSRHGRRYRI